jgi:hypothetical protein
VSARTTQDACHRRRPCSSLGGHRRSRLRVPSPIGATSYALYTPYLSNRTGGWDLTAAA